LPRRAPPPRQAPPEDDGRPAVAVRELLGPEAHALRLRAVAGRRGLDHTISLARVQRPGLALTGHVDYLRYGRVQILGGSELGYLRRLSSARRTALFQRVSAVRLSCFVVTKGLEPPAELLGQAEERGIPVLVTPLESTPFIKALSAWLEERLAPRRSLHGVLVDIFGLGVLILGDSGIGKSECALDLVDRGHRLVADDVVEVTRVGDALRGSSPALTRSHMEVRGLGLINIEHVYGVSSLRLRTPVDLVVRLERWEPGREYDRLGVREERQAVLGIDVPRVEIPVAPGRNLALLVEVAARMRLLRERGIDAAQSFIERYDGLLESRARARRPARRRG
jgi:HPr kinase/phosphorylase